MKERTTEKVYYEEPYLRSLIARVIERKEAEDGLLYAFDRTIFYPGSGGQLPDKGTIGGKEVLEVFEENGKIYHRLPAPLDCEECPMEINWERRYLFMKMHTGQHLFSAVLEKLFGWKTLSSSIQEDHVSVELSTSKAPWEKIALAELEALKAIQENRPVKIYWLAAEEARKLPLRKFVDVGERVRVVEIEGWDYSLCKGTHVRQTSEIGLIAVYGTDKVRGNTRLYFRVSAPALSYLQEARAKVKELVSSFGMEEERLRERVSQLVEEKRRLSKKLQKLEKTLAEEKIRELLEKKEDLILEELYFEDERAIKRIANALLREKRAGLLYSAKTGKLYLSLPEPELEEKVLGFLRKLGARGGGREGFYEFSLSEKKNLKEIVSSLKKSTFPLS